DAIRERAWLLHGEVRTAEFAVMTSFDLATQRHAECLLAVANAENRDIGSQNGGVDGWSVVIARRRGTSRENHTPWSPAHHGGARGLEGVELAINAGFTDASRDRLRGLRTEVQDEDGVVCGGGVWVQHGEALAAKRRLCKVLDAQGPDAELDG